MTTVQIACFWSLRVIVLTAVLQGAVEGYNDALSKLAKWNSVTAESEILSHLGAELTRAELNLKGRQVALAALQSPIASLPSTAASDPAEYLRAALRDGLITTGASGIVVNIAAHAGNKTKEIVECDVTWTERRERSGHALKTLVDLYPNITILNLEATLAGEQEVRSRLQFRIAPTVQGETRT